MNWYVLIATWLLIPPNGARQVCDFDPTSKAPPGSKVIQIKDFESKNLDYFDADQNGKAVYAPPTPAPAVETADTIGFEQALFEDPELSPVVKVELMKFFPLIDKHGRNPAVLVPAWGAVCAVYGKDWLTSEVQEKVEQYASRYKVQIK